MADTFDPYHTWLGIRPDEQPADHYRLIGITRFEDNADVISNAVDARMAFVRTMQSGGRAAMSQKILNELSLARVCLLDPKKKQQYDAQLKAKMAKENPAATPAIISQDQELVEIIDTLVEIPDTGIYGLTPLPSAPRAATNSWGSPAFGPVYEVRKRPSVPWVVAVIGGAAAALLLIIGIASWFFGRGTPQPTNVAQQLPQPTPASPSTPISQPQSTLPGQPRPSPVIPPLPMKVPNPNPFSPVGPPTKAATPPTKFGPSSSVPVPSQSSSSSQTASSSTTLYPAAPGNLLKMIPATAIKLSGKGKMEGQEGVLPYSFGTPAQIAIPVALPEEYEIETHVLREKANSSGSGFGLSADVGRNRCVLWIDGFQDKGSLTYLSEIDGKNGDSTSYPGTVYRGELIQVGKLARLVMQVRKQSIQLVVDGRSVFSWEGDPKRLRLRFNIRNVPSHQLFLSWDGDYRIKHVEVRPLPPTQL